MGGTGYGMVVANVWFIYTTSFRFLLFPIAAIKGKPLFTDYIDTFLFLDFAFYALSLRQPNSMWGFFKNSVYYSITR